MGYLFPGCLVLILTAYFYRLKFDIYAITSFDHVKQLIDMGSPMSWESSLLLVVMGYAIGHIVAYLSSLTIETLFTNKIFGYPSNYLLTSRNRSLKVMMSDFFKSDATNKCKMLKMIIKWFLKLLTLILILPISLGVFTVGCIADINGFIVRPLDPYLQKTLKEKQYWLAEKLRIAHPDVNEDCDYHRIVMHYVYLNLPGSNRKTDNYLALYGFLRSLAFILCILFLMLVILVINTINLSASFEIKIIFSLLFVGLISYMVYLGFVKFYRRFTLENYMSLLVGMPNDDTNSTDSIC